MIAPILALALAAAPQTDPASFQRGSGLYHDCKGAARYIDTSESIHTVEEGSQFDRCTFYIQGYVDGAPDGRFCAGRATIGTFVKVYVAYMEKTPKVLDEPRYVGLFLALQDAYPCPGR
jgi:Rap1a immunity proteins